MRFLLAICIYFSFCGVALGASSKIERIDALIAGAHARGVFNGVALVVQRGTPIYQHAIGFNSATRKQQLNMVSRFPIGSIAKEFNAVGIMFLVEAGKLNLDTPISQLLPELPVWAQQIRIIDLLRYTSGLPRMHEVTDEQFFLKLQEIKTLAFTPGQGYIYSNANVFLQQKIIERISKTSYLNFLRSTLLARSGSQITTPDGTTLAPSMAGSFDNDGRETTFSQGGETFYLTAHDLYLWVSALHSGKIISLESLRRLADRYDANSESSLGVAEIDAKGVSLHRHDGSGNNYEAVASYQGSSDTTILLLSNNQNFKLGELAAAIVAILDEQPYQIPKKSIYLDIRGKLERQFEDGLAFYRDLKWNKSEHYDFTTETGDLVKTANYLMRRERFVDAISILHLSLAVGESNKQERSAIYELLAACHSSIKQHAMASLYLYQSLVLDPANKRATQALARLPK